MLNYPTSQPLSSEPLSRSTLISLLEVALQTREYRYARQIALGWLAFFPGDLLVKLIYAQALYWSGTEQQALNILDEIIQLDPEFLEALQFQYKVSCASGKIPNDLKLSLFILDETYPEKVENFSIAHTYRRSYQWLIKPNRPLAIWEVKTLGLPTGENEAGSINFHLDDEMAIPLLGVIQLRCLIAQQADNRAILKLAQNYLEHWPKCLAFKLIFAQNKMAVDHTGGVNLLHEAVTVDTTAQVAVRIWGSEFPFKKIWPATLEVAPGHPTSPQSFAVPAPVSAVLGWNQLPTPNYPRYKDEVISPFKDEDQPNPVSTLTETGEKSDQPVEPQKSPQPYHPYPIISELRQIAKKMNQPALSRVDGRYPVYIIMSSKNGLVNKYGEEGAGIILEAMQRLAETIAKYRQWDSLVFLVDESDFGLSRKNIKIGPVQSKDPWAIKLALVDLDGELGKFGEMIGSVLIVGGPEIIPFHHLPNPVDDTDKDVPSDNPYATRDENYFVPEWPVGRLPSGKSNNPEMLIKLLVNSKAYHETLLHTQTGLKYLWKKIRNLYKNLPLKTWNNRKSYGYSAAIWRRASLSVFRPIGDPHHLFVSPPVQVKPSCAIDHPKKACLSLPYGRLAYFNLHGLADTDEWYGQRDPAEPGSDLDFPLALRAADIPTNGHTRSAVPDIVFSEACFGAHILEKNIDEAIALKFLSNGSQVVVGSTCISYGSIGTPLIAADLLGHTFWHYLKDGQPAGEALRRARIRLVKEMSQRQGYLDGEDQKTLLSFVFYGDPLIQINENIRGPKTTMRSNRNQAPIHIVCDRMVDETRASRIPSEVLAQVKGFVSEYLPGMSDAQLHISREQVNCDGKNHVCPASQLHAKSTLKQQNANRKVVTLSKTIHENSHKHAQFARMTLDENGNLVKLVVSR